MKILYLSTLVPAISGNGGKRAAYNHICNLQKNADSIHAVFLSVDGTSPNKEIFSPNKTDWICFSRELGRVRAGFIPKLKAFFNFIFSAWPRGYTVAYSKQASYYLEKFLKNSQIDVIVCEYLFGMALLEDCDTNLPIIYIAQNVEKDMLFDQMRFSSCWSMLKYFYFVEYFKMRCLEKRIIKKVNGTICISSKDVTPLIALADCDKNKIKSWQELNFIKPRLWKFTKSKRLLFVGSATHFPNIDAMKWLAKFLMPEIFKIDPEIQLFVVGMHKTDVPVSTFVENINFLGFISDKDLCEYHCTSDLFISPIRLGGGIKMKVLDVLSYGMPFIASEESLQGIDFLDSCPIVDFSDVQKTASLICELMSSPDMLTELSHSMLSQLRNSEASRPDLLDVIKTFIN